MDRKIVDLGDTIVGTHKRTDWQKKNGKGFVGGGFIFCIMNSESGRTFKVKNKEGKCVAEYSQDFDTLRYSVKRTKMLLVEKYKHHEFKYYEGHWHFWEELYKVYG